MHKPPGSGRTIVIAVVIVKIIASLDASRNVKLAAQSNVTIKIITGKLGLP